MFNVVKMRLREKNAADLGFRVGEIGRSQGFFGVQPIYPRQKVKLKVIS
jgi:hypothetical protein